MRTPFEGIKTGFVSKFSGNNPYVFNPGDFAKYDGVAASWSIAGTNYQDVAGQTLAVDVSDPVALMIDGGVERKDVEIGPDNTFQSQSEWNQQGTNPAPVISGGIATLTRAPAGGEDCGSSVDNLNLVAGEFYFVEMEILSVPGDITRPIGLYHGTTQVMQPTSVGIHTVIYSPSVTLNDNIHLRIRQANPVANVVATLGGYSFKKIIGYHASQPVAAQQPEIAETTHKEIGDEEYIDTELETDFLTGVGATIDQTGDGVLFANNNTYNGRWVDRATRYIKAGRTYRVTYTVTELVGGATSHRVVVGDSNLNHVPQSGWPQFSGPNNFGLGTFTVDVTLDTEATADRYIGMSMNHSGGSFGARATYFSVKEIESTRTYRHLLTDGIDDSMSAILPDMGTNATVWSAGMSSVVIEEGLTIGAGSYELLADKSIQGVVHGGLELSELNDLLHYLKKFSPAKYATMKSRMDVIMMNAVDAKVYDTTRDDLTDQGIAWNSDVMNPGPDLVDTANDASAWVSYASNVLTQDGDAIKIVYVDNKWGGKIVLNDAGGLTENLIVGKAASITCKVKVNSGSVNMQMAGNVLIGGHFATVVDTDYVEVQTVFTATDTLPHLEFDNMSAGEIVWIKDIVVNYVDDAMGALGPELAPSVDFSDPSGWSLGTDWSIENGQATHDGASSGYLTAGGIMTVGKPHLITLDVDSVSGSGLALISAFWEVNYTFPITDGVMMIMATPLASDFRLYQHLVGKATLNSVSIREVAQSWYWEELNTATRGATRNFPKISVITSGTSNEVTIYDATDPTLPMWLHIPSVSSVSDMLFRRQISEVTALNGEIFVACPDEVDTGGYHGLARFNFVTDVVTNTNYAGTYTFPENISQRGDAVYTSESTSGPEWVPPGMGSVATFTPNVIDVKALPGAPIDVFTGMPVPTIIAGDVDSTVGLTVIKDDGNIWDIIGQIQGTGYLGFTRDNKIMVKGAYGDDMRVFDIPTADVPDFNSNNQQIRRYNSSNPWTGGGTPHLALHSGNGSFTATDLGEYIGVISNSYDTNQRGFSLIDENPSDFISGMSAHITHDYNTGWMVGQIHGAYMSSTDSTDLVGRILDVNETFDSDVSGWGTYGAATIVWDNGRALIDVNAGTHDGAYLNLNTVIGRNYRVSGDIENITGGGAIAKLIVGPSVSSASTLYLATTTSEHLEGYFLAADATRVLSLQTGNDPFDSMYADNIEVEKMLQVGEYFTPAGYDGVTTSIDATSFTVAIGTIASRTVIEIATVIGKTYRVKYTRNSVDASSIVYAREGNSGFGTIVNQTTVDNDLVFIATSTVMAITWVTNLLEVMDYSDISIELVDEDRSVNVDHLTPHGVINRTEVADGAELVGYSGFKNGPNPVYMGQDYNASLEFGTGDFCVSSWFKCDPYSGWQTIMIRQDGGMPGPDFGVLPLIRMTVDADGKLNCITGSTNATVGVTTVTDGEWHLGTVLRRSGVIEIWVDDVLDATKSVTTDLSNATATLKIGVLAWNYKITDRFLGELSLIRITETAPTPEQIDKMYKDELKMFQPGAAITIAGPDKTVRDLANDPDLGLVHVGLDGGTSVFNDLVRIDQNNNEVTTTLDVVSGMVAGV